MILYYFFDPLCGWCYGFSPVIKKFVERHKHELDVELIGGGMVRGESEKPIADMEPFIREANKKVENVSGVKFGEKFHEVLDEGTRVYSSVPGCIALNVYKSFTDKRQLEFGTAMQQAIYKDGVDPYDMEYFADIAARLNVDKSEFLVRSELDMYRKEAYDDFSVTQQFKVTGYPTLVLHFKDEFFLLSKGFTDLDNLEKTFSSITNSLQMS